MSQTRVHLWKASVYCHSRVPTSLSLQGQQVESIRLPVSRRILEKQGIRRFPTFLVESDGKSDSLRGQAGAAVPLPPGGLPTSGLPAESTQYWPLRALERYGICDSGAPRHLCSRLPACILWADVCYPSLAPTHILLHGEPLRSVC
jgi:hypothetical protein